MAAAPLAPFDRIAAINSAIQDLGSIVRRSQAGSLDQDSFYELAGRLRRTLKQLRVALTEDELDERLDGLALTDLGAAIGRLVEAGVITPASQLLDGVGRARTYGHLAVIDGDLSALPADPTQQGA